ncbi:hypothetical protein, partial [Acidisphaera sp. S103]|uniref:hypothetical protein n=1 Tax=Acidisphaera sp. S103 TaxID=1747223 RepID=UPI001C202590
FPVTRHNGGSLTALARRFDYPATSPKCPTAPAHDQQASQRPRQRDQQSSPNQPHHTLMQQHLERRQPRRHENRQQQKQQGGDLNSRHLKQCTHGSTRIGKRRQRRQIDRQSIRFDFVRCHLIIRIA